MTVNNTYYALLRLGKQKNVLYNEYIRAKRDAFTRAELIELFKEILEKKIPNDKKVYKLINCFFKKGVADD